MINSRRNFLKVAGFSFAGSFANPILAKAENTTNRNGNKNGSLKVGLLIPKTVEFSESSASFQNGLRLGLFPEHSKGSCNVQLISESIGNGNAHLTKSKIQQLANENNVDILVGILNPEIGNSLSQFIEEEKIPFIIAHTGENYLSEKLHQNSYMFFNSLNLIETAFYSGKLAVEKYGTNVFVVTSMYDSGYDAFYSFRLGVESSGGRIIETYIDKNDSEDFIAETLQSIVQNKPDCIYTHLSGKSARDIIRNLSLAGNTVPMITTSFVAENGNLVNMGGWLNESFNVSPWCKNIQNQENKEFVKNFRTQFSKDPGLLSVLGYETAILINDAWSKFNSGFSGKNLAETLMESKILSPRGEISLNRKTGKIQSQVYICKIQNSEFNISENYVSEIIPHRTVSQEVIIPENVELKSGWINPYLFA